MSSLSANSTDSLAEASMEYIRAARRLRQLHRGDPARLHRSLRQLAVEADGRAGVAEAALPPAGRGTAAVLTREVEEAMDGPILRYDERSRLLRRADELQIGRFEANLLIASVQHRRRGESPPARERSDEAHRPWGVWNVLAVAVAVEAAAIVVGWWALLSG